MNLKIILILLIISFKPIFVNAQNTIDPQVLELVEDYKNAIASGDTTNEKKIKSEILEIANHAYSDRLQEIDELLKKAQKAVLTKVSEENRTSKSSVPKAYDKNVLSFSINESSFCAVKSPNIRFNGLYKYRGKEARFWKYEEGEPIVELGEHQKGKFQNHGQPALEVTWWLESDCKGNIASINGALADRYTLVIRYEESGPDGYPVKGSFDRMMLDAYKGESTKIVILGEREKN